MPVLVVTHVVQEASKNQTVTLADIGARLKITRTIDIASLPCRARAAIIGRILQYACESIPYHEPGDPLQLVRKPVTALQGLLVKFGEGDAGVTVDGIRLQLSEIEGRTRIAQAARCAVQAVVDSQAARTLVPQMITDVVATLLEERVPTQTVRGVLRAVEQFYAMACGDVRAACGRDIAIPQYADDPLHVMRAETEQRAFDRRVARLDRFSAWTEMPSSDTLAD